MNVNTKHWQVQTQNNLQQTLWQNSDNDNTFTIKLFVSIVSVSILVNIFLLIIFTAVIQFTTGNTICYKLLLLWKESNFFTKKIFK